MDVPIFKVCRADVAVQALLGTDPMHLFLFGRNPFEPVIYPYAVWQDISGEPYNRLDKTPDTDRLNIQINVYADTAAEAEQIAKAIRDAVEPFSYVTSWRGSGTDPDTKKPFFGFDVAWHVYR